MKNIELLFERILWLSRLVVVVPVVVSILVSIALFYTSTVDALSLIGRMFGYAAITDEAARTALRLDSLADVVAIIDNYLLASLLILFGLGLYELYINKIDAIENSEFASRLLLIKSFDDLKDRLANVVLLILVVKFFQQALSLKYETLNDLLLLSVGIALIGLSFFLTRKNTFTKV
jgi:uncharacterized membrane protein YqhA